MKGPRCPDCGSHETAHAMGMARGWYRCKWCGNLFLLKPYGGPGEDRQAKRQYTWHFPAPQPKMVEVSRPLPTA